MKQETYQYAFKSVHFGKTATRCPNSKIKTEMHCTELELWLAQSVVNE